MFNIGDKITYNNDKVLSEFDADVKKFILEHKVFTITERRKSDEYDEQVHFLVEPCHSVGPDNFYFLAEEMVLAIPAKAPTLKSLLDKRKANV